MKNIIFDCWMSWGKGDCSDWEIEVEVTDEEFERLKIAALDGFDFEDAEDVADIYQRVYKGVVEDSTEVLLSDDPDLAEEYGDEEGWSADELYSFGINFSEDFLNDLEELEEGEE